MEVILHNRLAELPKAHDLLDEFAVRHGLPATTAAGLHVALEEHLTNIINYGYREDQRGQIVLRFQFSSSECRIEIEDDGTRFNPLEAPPVDVNQPLEDRPIGGLGIQLIRELTDELRYEHRAGHNLLVMVKRVLG